MSAQTEIAAFDRVQLAVVQSALIGVSREMGTIMERASYSAILNEGKDFSCAVFNRDGELVAEGEFVLVHLAAMHEAVQVLIHHFASSWAPGDIAIHNDPYEGGSHLPDVNLVRPVFYEEEVIAYVATRAHYPDVGGRTPGSFSGEAQTLFEEGVVIPPLLLAREDKIDEQLVAFIARNVRAPRQLRADLMAQVASVRVGERSLIELAKRIGRASLLDVLTVIPEYGEELMRKRIERTLSGSNSYYDFMDDGGPETGPVQIHLVATKSGSQLVFDYRESAPQAACPINAPLAVVKSATFGAVKCSLIPELPLNSGMFRPLTILTSPGSITHPLPPAPVAAGNTNTSQRIFDICVACLGEMFVQGSSGMAGSYSANSDIGIGGEDPRTREEFVLYMMPVGGIGARPTADGESALINYMGNCSSQPVEAWEAMHPLRVGEYRLRRDSAGAGRRRGGFGLSLSYEALVDGVEVSVFTERQRLAPPGLHCGQPAKPGEYWLERDGQVIPLQTKTSGLWLRRGDRLVVKTAGGAGYGDPFDREPELVAADLQQQFLSPEHASHAYGIVVNAEGGVDDSATLGQRIILRRERDQRQLRIDAIRSHSGAAIVAVPSAVATALRIAPHQVLYCASSVCGVYAEAEITDVKGIEVGRPVASALHVSVGDRIQITPMSSSWLPHSTAELRRQFSIHQLHADGRGRVGHH